MENYKGTVITTMQPEGILIYKDEANMQNKNAYFIIRFNTFQVL